MNLVLLWLEFVLFCGAFVHPSSIESRNDYDTTESLRLAWAVKRLVHGQCRIPGPVGPKGECGLPGPQADCGPLEMRVNDLEGEITTMKSMFPEAFCLLGMKNGSIPDSAITVSTMHSAGYCEIPNSRLDHHGAWCATANTPGSQWIQVDLGKVQTVTGVVTQGQGNYPGTNEWITSFKIEHGEVEGSRISITENGNAKIFAPVNFNKNTKVVTRFPIPLQARFIRIIPHTYTGHISMRFDVINC